MKTKSENAAADASRRPGQVRGARKFGILSAMSLMTATALVGADRAVNSFVAVEGEGVSLDADGSICVDEGSSGSLTVSARPGWLVNGRESVTGNPANGTLRDLSMTSRLGESTQHLHVFPFTEREEHVPDECNELSVAVDPRGIVKVYALPAASAEVSAEATATVARKARHRKVKTYSKCSFRGCNERHDPEVEYGEPFEVEPDRYAWTATAEGQTSNGSAWTGYMGKGTGKEIKFHVKGTRSGCADCECEAEATAKADVYELSIDLRDEFLGLNLKDEMKGKYVTRDASAKIDPEPKSVAYSWVSCGQCDFIGDTDKADVTYGATDKNKGSGRYRAEDLVVCATVTNEDGLTDSASCTTNFTVVRVDVAIAGVGEDKEETEGAYVQYVPDKDGFFNVEATGKTVGVSFTCEPELPPEEKVKITSSGPGELYEKLENGEIIRVMSANYPACEVAEHKFLLHGHSMSSSHGQGKLMIAHLKSGAVDLAEFSTFGIEVLTYAAAPNNGDSHRTVLGVGEKVVITTYPQADRLSCVSGKLTLFHGAASKYEASHIAGSDEVVAEFERFGQCTVDFTILEPSGYIINAYESDRYPRGAAGAGMKIDLQMSPLEVSLSEVEFREIGTTSTDAKGYFAKPQFAKYLVHHTTDWKGVGINNEMGTDHAFAGFLEEPWESGSFSWDIPARWRVCGDDIPGSPLKWSSQGFTIDKSGTVCVEKFGLRVIREVSQNYGLITSEGE